MSSPAPSESDNAGDDIRMHGDPNENDSSEEEEDDEEEAARIRAGFIVDEDEDEDEDMDPEEKKRRRRKHRKRKRAEAEALDEDDLELMLENSGARHPSDAEVNRKRHKHRGSPGSAEEDDRALGNMFDEPTLSRSRGDDPEEDDMDDFIEEDEDEEIDEETRAQLRRQKKEAKRANARKVRSNAGVGQEIRAELEDVFGAGDEYDEILGDEEKASKKQIVRMEDIFEPTEMAERYLLPIDTRIRDEDKAERFQLSSSSLSTNPIYAEDSSFPPLDSAVSWVARRVSSRTNPFSQGFRIGDPRDSQIIKAEFEQAVKVALHGMFEQGLEVPYLHRHKSDAFIDALQSPEPLLQKEELWMCYDLGLRYRAIHSKRATVDALYTTMKEIDPTFVDEYFEDKVLSVPDGTASQSIEAGNEALEWLDLRYPSLVQDVKTLDGKMIERKRAGAAISRRVKHEGSIGKFVERCGLAPSEVASRIYTNSRSEEPENPDQFPASLAEQYTNEMYRTGEDVLKAARHLLIQEFGCDPLLRQWIRERAKTSAVISCKPTVKGASKIDELHMFYRFKYLREKPVTMILEDQLFTQMLAAEAEGLVEISINLSEHDRDAVQRQLMDFWDYPYRDGDEIGEAWSDFKLQVTKAAFETLLLPKATEWLKDELRQTSEDNICQRCQDELERRVDMQPFGSKNGSSVSVLAISFGRGGKDAVMAVFLDNKGHISAQSKFDGLGAGEAASEFLTFVQEIKPDVVVIGGFTAETHRLRIEADGILKDLAAQEAGRDGMMQGMSGFAEQEYLDALSRRQIPLIYVQDEVARLYMNSARAIQENPAWPANARYALGLARFVQDPLNEYCALGPDLTAITYFPKLQALVSQERLLQCLERALVNVVNAVGVDINQAVREPYLQKLLPFVAGLGPRKAEALIRNITRAGGSLENRKKLIDLLPATVAINVASFLYIAHEQLFEADIPDDRDDLSGPDPLDHTRIHPRHYELAHEFAENVLGLDPEDAREQNPSKAVVQLWSDEQLERKVAGMVTEKWVEEVYRKSGERLKHLIDMIIRELVEPYQDTRPPFSLPDELDILRMLTGETLETLDKGKIVTAHVTMVKPEAAYVRLDSGVTGEIPVGYIADMAQNAKELLNKSQAVRGVIVTLRAADLYVEMTIRHDDVARAAHQALADNRDVYFDIGMESIDKEKLLKQKRVREAGLPRVIDHPAWKHVNNAQAEQMLKDKQPGEAVIRPSSKGIDHIAVTWKVADGLYQHVDVIELNKPSDSELGTRLRVAGAGESTYSDLDDLLVNYIGAVARKLDTLMQHEKYRSAEELDEYLSALVQARPGSSAYGFSLDKKHPGWVKLSFLSRAPKAGGQVQTWPVKVKPGAYSLFDAECPGMMELCNAFKTRYRHELEQQKSLGGATPRHPGMTPFGGGRTPAGGRTPGGTAFRPPGMGGSTPRPPGMGGTPMGVPHGHEIGGRTPMRPPGMGTPIARPPTSMGGGMTPRPPGYGSTPFGFGAPQANYGLATPNPYATTPFGQHHQAIPPPVMAPPPPPPPGGSAFRPPAAGGMNPERARMIAQGNNWNGQ